MFRDEIAPTGHENEYRLAQNLKRALSRSGYKIMIPKIVLSESFCIYPEAEQISRFNSIYGSSGFMMPDFDEGTSRILARILNQRIEGEERAYQDFTTKQLMKYDSLILASAIQHGAGCFYTNDSDFSRYPSTYISIKGLQEAPPSYLDEGFFGEEE